MCGGGGGGGVGRVGPRGVTSLGGSDDQCTPQNIQSTVQQMTTGWGGDNTMEGRRAKAKKDQTPQEPTPSPMQTVTNVFNNAKNAIGRIIGGGSPAPAAGPTRSAPVASAPAPSTSTPSYRVG
jgi:hypothetical protein